MHRWLKAFSHKMLIDIFGPFSFSSPTPTRHDHIEQSLIELDLTTEHNVQDFLSLFSCFRCKRFVQSSKNGIVGHGSCFGSVIARLILPLHLLKQVIDSVGNVLFVVTEIGMG